MSTFRIYDSEKKVYKDCAVKTEHATIAGAAHLSSVEALKQNEKTGQYEGTGRFFLVDLRCNHHNLSGPLPGSFNISAMLDEEAMRDSYIASTFDVVEREEVAV